MGHRLKRSRYTLQFTSLYFTKVHFGRFDLTKLRGARERDGRAIALLRVRRAVPAIEGGVQLERRALRGSASGALRPC